MTHNAIFLNAGHDRNGNARRGWLISNEFGTPVDFVKDSGRGSDYDLSEYPTVIHGYGMVEIAVTATELRRLSKEYGRGR